MCYERTENRETGRCLSIMIESYLDFSYQLPNRNKCYLLGEHKNRLNTFSDLTKMLGLCTEWLNICKRSLPVPNNFHFLFLYLSVGVTSSFSVPTEAIGLYNVGQSCCLNSVLQVFLMNIHFTRILRRYHLFELPEIFPLLLCCLHSFFFHMWCTFEGLDQHGAFSSLSKALLCLSHTD